MVLWDISMFKPSSQSGGNFQNPHFKYSQQILHWLQVERNENSAFKQREALKIQNPVRTRHTPFRFWELPLLSMWVLASENQPSKWSCEISVCLNPAGKPGVLSEIHSSTKYYIGLRWGGHKKLGLRAEISAWNLRSHQSKTYPHLKILGTF